MELKDFIYHYSKIYLAEMIKEVHATENWADREFDVKYARYLQEFISAENKMKKLEDKIGRTLKEPECRKFFVGLTKIRMKEAYDYIADLFIENIQGHKTLTVEDLVRIEKRLDSCRQEETFSMEFLNELRNIEEEVLGRVEAWK